jgi:hypothetical protein
MKTKSTLRRADGNCQNPGMRGGSSSGHAYHGGQSAGSGRQNNPDLPRDSNIGARLRRYRIVNSQPRHASKKARRIPSLKTNIIRTPGIHEFQADSYDSSIKETQAVIIRLREQMAKKKREPRMARNRTIRFQQAAYHPPSLPPTESSTLPILDIARLQETVAT